MKEPGKRSALTTGRCYEERSILKKQERKWRSSSKKKKKDIPQAM